MSLENPSTYYTITRKYDLHYPDLEGDIEAEVVIIGGGFTGINTALELAERGIKDVVVLENNYLGFGGSGRNGGHVMAGIGHDLDKIAKDVGPDGLEAILKISDIGASIIKERIKKYDIDADFQHGYGYMGWNKRQAKTLQSWQRIFSELNPDQEITYLEGSQVHDIVGSDKYTCGLKHMGNGHVHVLNLLLGAAKAFTEVHGGKIYENTPALEVEYGKQITVRTAKGSVKANKMLWACGAFLDKLEPNLHKTTVNVYAFNSVTEPLPEELIKQISAIRGAFSDISPIIDYYRVTNENRLLYGTCGLLLEYIPNDLKAFLHKKLMGVFPYLKDVKLDLAWGGPMECTLNFFPQVGSLEEHDNVFFVQGYNGFGVTPSHVIAQVIADGMGEGSKAWDAMRSIPRKTVYGKDNFRSIVCSLGKTSQQIDAYRVGRR
ncbi:MAG: FAD-binding oxidoreductase [Neptuniibacter sp.]